MTKNILLLAVLGLLILPRPAASGQSGIAAVVNDSVVTVTDVQDRIRLYAGGPVPPERAAQMQAQVLDKLINETLELQQAEKLGITVDDGMVQKGLEHLASQNQLSADAFREKIKQAGANVNSLLAQIRADIAWDFVVRRELRPRINVSEREIDLTLEHMKQEGGKQQYRVAEIFLPVDTPAHDSDARGKAAELVADIRGGEHFSEAARQFSQSPGASNGGDLGWIEEGQLAEPLDQALRKLHPGELSDPIRSDKGYHILFLRAARAAGAADNAPAAAPDLGPVVLIKQLFIPTGKKDGDAVLKAKFARGLALQKEVKSCDALEKRMKEFANPGTRTLGEGPQNQLSPPLRAIVEKLEVNQLSPPLRTPEGFAMLMVCKRETPKPQEAAAPEAPAPAQGGDEESKREDIAGTLGNQRLDKMAERYLRDLRAAAFIDKRL